MFVRILSATLLFPILFFLVLAGGVYLKLGVIFTSLVGLYEFYKAVLKKLNFVTFIGFFTTIVYVIFLNTQYDYIFNILFVLLLLIALSSMVIKYKTISIYDLSITFFGFLYITVMFSTVYLIRSFNYGVVTVWILFLSAWSCDTGAYFVGKFFGKNKLAPSLSPKKTVEGSIGGVIFSIFFCGLYGFLICYFNQNSSNLFNNKLLTILIFCIIGFFGSIFAQFGDLVASSIKRKFDIKDYGKLIPGHGGILDRFDSIIFTAGASYIILKIIEVFDFFN